MGCGTRWETAGGVRWHITGDNACWEVTGRGRRWEMVGDGTWWETTGSAGHAGLGPKTSGHPQVGEDPPAVKDPSGAPELGYRV